MAGSAARCSDGAEEENGGLGEVWYLPQPQLVRGCTRTPSQAASQHVRPGNAPQDEPRASRWGQTAEAHTPASVGEKRQRDLSQGDSTSSPRAAGQVEELGRQPPHLISSPLILSQPSPAETAHEQKLQLRSQGSPEADN